MADKKSTKGPAANVSNTRTELRDRLVDYYRHHAPEKVDLVDDLVATRFSESSIMTALSAKYGMDPAAETRSLPKMRNRSLLAVEIQDDSEGALQGTVVSAAEVARATSSGRGRNDKASPRPAPEPAASSRLLPAGGPVATQLILSHLRAAGHGNVADVMVNELRSAGISHTFYSAPDSPVALDDRQSALSAVLNPASTTRFYIGKLIQDIDLKRVSTLPGRQHDAVTAAALDALAREPVWSDLHFGRTRRRTYLGTAGSPVPRAAPVNQLIGTITRVVIRPHVSIPESVEKAVSDLEHRLLATHRHFIPSHVLLAKLLERFFVPLNLPLSHRYDANGILIDAPRTDRRAVVTNAETSSEVEQSRFTYLQQATRVIHIKVLGVVATWLARHPHHFDELMCTAVAAFVDEVCYQPTIWSLGAPGELAQIAEQIKLTLRMRADDENFTDERGGHVGGTSSHGARAHWAPGVGHAPVNAVPPDVENTRALLFAGGGSHRGGGGGASGAMSAQQRFAAPPAGMTVSSSNGGDRTNNSPSRHGGRGGSAQATTGSFFLRIDELRLANQLSAIDHRLFRAVAPDDLYTFTAVATSAMFHSDRTPAAGLLAFIKAGMSLTNWAVTQVLLAAPVASSATSSGRTHRHPQQQQDSTLVQSATNRSNAVAASADKQGQGNVTAESNVAARCNVIAKLVALCYRLVELNNLHGAFHVYAALRHPAVTRLRATWAQVQAQTVGSLDELHRFFAFERGMRGYREYVASVPDDDVYPLIPVLAAPIDEVRRLMASEPTVLRDAVGSAVLHWRKFDALGTVLGRVADLQAIPVPAEFSLVPDCVDWLRDSFAEAFTNPDDMIEASLAVEPETTNDQASRQPQQQQHHRDPGAAQAGDE